MNDQETRLVTTLKAGYQDDLARKVQEAEQNGYKKASSVRCHCAFNGMYFSQDVWIEEADLLAVSGVTTETGKE